MSNASKALSLRPALYGSIQHYRLISRDQARRLRDRDSFEQALGRQIEFTSPKKRGARPAA
jgi:hypothetical protein